MPSGRRRTTLTPEREQRLEVELLLYKEALQRAEEDLKLHIFRASEAGMSLRKLATILEIRSPDTIARWRDEGEQARDRRSSEDPLRPGE
jgi:hypothetical protein